MKVTTFGEAVFRFSTPVGERLNCATNLNFHLGGSELNIAANLGSLGIKGQWVSALPDRMTGEMMLEKIQQHGIDTSFCQVIKGGRPGWYLVEAGTTPRPDLVYNRYASSMSELKSFSFDWQKILQASSLFHTSGITAGLSYELTAEVAKSMQAARMAGALVSYDFNYRKNIWSKEEFIQRQQGLLPLIDLLFCSETDLELFFKKPVNSDDYSMVFEGTPLKFLVVSERNAEDTTYGLKLVTPDSSYRAKSHRFHQLDRIGVGDSMAAGFIAGLLKHQDPKLACEWGAAAGALKYGIKGDMALLKQRELLQLIEDGFKGIIR